jgi:hypothetical protein
MMMIIAVVSDHRCGIAGVDVVAMVMIIIIIIVAGDVVINERRRRRGVGADLDHLDEVEPGRRLRAAEQEN